MNDMLWLLIIIGGTVLAFWLYFKFFKIYKIKNIVFIDGTVGSGKTFYSVALAVRLYKKQLLWYRIKCVVFGALGYLSPKFRKLRSCLEEPLLYSNIKLRNVKFVPLTKDLIFRRNYRFAYYSVVLIDEMALMADQFLFKDREASERLTNFFKLFRHECRGFAVINSQSTSDLHYSIKYVLSDYLYIHHRSNWGLFSVLRVQEMMYCADKDGQHIMNVRNEDIDENLRAMVVFNKYFRYFDSYCYSVFTDCLPVDDRVLVLGKDDSLKSADIVSFKEYKYLWENLNNNETSKS